MAKKVLKIILRIVIVIVLILAAGIGVLTALEYRPDAVEAVTVEGEAEAQVKTGESIKLVSWNIG